MEWQNAITSCLWLRTEQVTIMWLSCDTFAAVAKLSIVLVFVLYMYMYMHVKCTLYMYTVQVLCSIQYTL